MKKNWNFSKAQFLWYDCTFKKQCTVSVTLTIDLWRSMFFQWIECHPINILHKFQIDISSNSREIKYQNIGRTHTQTDTHTHRQTDRQTGWKQYLATPSGGEVIILNDGRCQEVLNYGRALEPHSNLVFIIRFATFIPRNFDFYNSKFRLCNSNSIYIWICHNILY